MAFPEDDLHDPVDGVDDPETGPYTRTAVMAAANQAIRYLNGAKLDLSMIEALGDMFLGTGPGVAARLAAGPAGSVLASGGAGPAWVQARVFNVTHPDFGAKLDGTTDDTAAINYAITAAAEAAASRSGGIVDIGVGDVKLTGPLEWQNGVWLRSVDTAMRGTGITRLIQYTAGANIIEDYEGAGVAVARISGIEMEYSPTASAGTACINLSSGAYLILEDILFGGNAWSGVVLDVLDSIWMKHVNGGCVGTDGAFWLKSGSGVTLADCSVGSSQNGPGLRIDAVNTVNAWNYGGVHCNPALQDNGGDFHHFFNFQSDHAENSAVVVASGAGARFWGGMITSSGRASADGLTVVNPGYGIEMQAGSAGLLAYGLVVENNGGDGLYVAGGDIQLNGGQFLNNADGVNFAGAATRFQSTGTAFNSNRGYGIGGTAAQSGAQIEAARFDGNTSGPVQSGITGLTVRNSGGYNPVGSVTVAVPASSTSTTDAFTRANGALGTGWTDFAALAMAISSDQVVGGGGHTSFSGAVRTGESYGNDQSSQLDIVTIGPLSGATGSRLGVGVRMTSQGDGYWAYYNYNNGSPEVQILKGGGTLLANATVARAWTSGDTLKLTASGSTLTASVNGQTVVTVTDSTYTSGSPGMVALGAPIGDNWQGSSLNTVAAVPYDRVFHIQADAGSSCEVSVANASGAIQPVVTIPAGQLYPVEVRAGCTMTISYTGTAPTWTVQGK